VVSHALVLLPFFGFVWFAVPLTRMAIGLWSRRKTGGRLPGKLSNFSHWSESRVLLTLAGINACTISLGLLFWWAGYLPQYP